MKFELPPAAGPLHPFGGPRLQEAAGDSLAAAIESGAAVYDRDRHLPRLIAVLPGELKDESPSARRTLLARLARALRAERNRGRAGHWTYDLNRHIALRQAYVAERARRPQ